MTADNSFRPNLVRRAASLTEACVSTYKESVPKLSGHHNTSCVLDNEILYQEVQSGGTCLRVGAGPERRSHSRGKINPLSYICEKKDATQHNTMLLLDFPVNALVFLIKAVPKSGLNYRVV